MGMWPWLMYLYLCMPLDAVQTNALWCSCMQVCLTAETCEHAEFDARVDMWYSSAPFTCGDAPRREVHFMDLYKKVGRRETQRQLLSFQSPPVDVIQGSSRAAS